MEYKKVALKEIKCDVTARTHPDDERLCNSIELEGIKEPLRVEGPNQEGKYYIIDGYRRWTALKKLKKGSFLVPVITSGKCTTVQQRNIARFNLQNITRRTTGMDKTFLVEQIMKQGNMEVEEIRIALNLTRTQMNKIKKALAIAEEKRQAVAKVRGSNEALEIIESAPFSAEIKGWLFDLLLERDLTGEGARAIKKIVRIDMYSLLSEEQKRKLIEDTLRCYKFDDNKAYYLVMEELMRTNPKHHSEILEEWINYICWQADILNELIDPNLKNMISSKHLQKLQKSLSKPYIKVYTSKSVEDVSERKQDKTFEKKDTSTGFTIYMNAESVRSSKKQTKTEENNQQLGFWN
ncbi:MULTISPECIES: ParB N-terminal domain-containing protein [unclassified Bacillus (in: firmicutes)]|uniref:ParB/RepB/Spo0J family partition protein n=1 Tax=unclassified Bacillus (in: firmicutes) TaxID=185979 RepID=UPI0008EF6E56|nr:MULTISPECIES: ParB N-terminal domain-containing protein [unclassified Bacillus (in: firmicutes)]SFI07783.1 ParB/RepB/Spo0J family partition protein [Bacillus sp. 71mf]SFS78047.1 ParB/RepB/Spo0J family partition protein [Bacillus sp. 103mf]